VAALTKPPCWNTKSPDIAAARAPAPSAVCAADSNDGPIALGAFAERNNDRARPTAVCAWAATCSIDTIALSPRREPLLAENWSPDGLARLLVAPRGIRIDRRWGIRRVLAPAPGRYKMSYQHRMDKTAKLAGHAESERRGVTMSTVSFRNRDGKLVDVPVVAASRLKNEFGTVFEEAAVGGAVVITKHNTPRAVLLSYAEFEALTAAATPALDDLSARFDTLLATMQTPEAKAGVAAAFDATPEELGAAAVRAARASRRR
jgi:antitoxin Phd